MGTIDADSQAIADGICEQRKIRARSTPDVENTLPRPRTEQLCLPRRRSGPLAGHPLHQRIGLTRPIDIVECSHLHMRHTSTVRPVIRAYRPYRRERDTLRHFRGSTSAVRLRASNRPSRTDLRLSGSKTDLAKCGAEHLLLVSAEQLLSSPRLDDDESAIRRITQMHHEPVRGTAQVL
jgi:hypothetical protein